MVRREKDFEIGPFKQLVTLLSDGVVHSPSLLEDALGVTQNSLLELLQQFPAWDIPLESTDKGYCLPNGLSLLDKSKIHAYLPADNQDLTIELWDSLPSTNDYLMQKKFDEGLARCCLAEQQTQGKGRRGRQWISPFARNIYLSLLWPFPSTIEALSMVSLITAISVARSLQSLNLPTGLGLKWPNDVLWKNKKLAGILIESMDERQGIRPVVIGIGLNVEMPVQAGQQINQAWTDLSTITGKPRLDRNEIAGRLLNELTQNLRLFQDQGFAPFKETWQALDLTLNKSISIITQTQILQGEGRGINGQGYLLLELEAGEIRAFSSGEVSVSLVP